jgi:hypothetical protein
MTKAVKELLKLSSMTGRDLRYTTPFTANMPTEDSKQPAYRTLAMSQKVGRVGPGQVGTPPKMPGPTVKDMAPPSPTTKGDLPKMGADMSDRITNDPLVQYLGKHAAELETNLEDMKKEENRPAPRQMFDPHLTGDAVDSARKDRDILEELFANHKSQRKFGLDRD